MIKRKPSGLMVALGCFLYLAAVLHFTFLCYLFGWGGLDFQKFLALFASGGICAMTGEELMNKGRMHQDAEGDRTS